MLTVSLHGIKITAPYGLYPEERFLYNTFEVDVDIWVEHDNVNPWPFVDYTDINKIVRGVFEQPAQLIEVIVQHIYNALKQNIVAAEKIKVTVRKYHPPMEGDVQYAQICYEA